MGLPRDEIAGLIRAAKGYGNVNWKQLEQLTDIPAGTIKNWASGRTGIPSGDQADRIADACGVPRQLFALGWAPVRRPVSDLQAMLYEAARAEPRSLTPELAQILTARLQELLAQVAGEEMPGTGR